MNPKRVLSYCQVSRMYKQEHPAQVLFQLKALLGFSFLEKYLQLYNNLFFLRKKKKEIEASLSDGSKIP